MREIKKVVENKIVELNVVQIDKSEGNWHTVKMQIVEGAKWFKLHLEGVNEKHDITVGKEDIENIKLICDYALSLFPK